MVKFSVCVPNFNYARYLSATIRSVLDQSYGDFELLVSDNASTDNSLEVIRSFDDPRLKWHVNRRNVGFAGNLDRVARMASGDFMVMLSSDDLMLPCALETYARVLQAQDSEGTVISSSVLTIDSQGERTGLIGCDWSLWEGSAEKVQGSNDPKRTCRSLDAPVLLGRAMRRMRNPFNFASTCYPRVLYDAVEGYGGGRLINPDKWFNWKLLVKARTASWLDEPLFAYRVHGGNQSALQSRAGALRFLVDEYVSSLEADEEMLGRAGMDQRELQEAFVEFTIGRHGLSSLAREGRVKAMRVFSFGSATYPQLTRRNRKAALLRVLLLLGPIGTAAARWSYRSYTKRGSDDLRA